MVKLVIADDHLVVRDALCEMFTHKGTYQIVGQAADGDELLNVLKNSKPDLVLLDLEMPKLDGIQALEKLKESNSQVPILILSANDTPRSVRAALRAGAKGFVTKQAAISELEFAITSVLDGKTYLSPSVTTMLMSPESSEVNGNSPLAVLTKRELEVLTHLADGKPNRIIGKLLHISTRTVDTHRSNILKKLNVKTNAELVKLAISHGLISV